MQNVNILHCTEKSLVYVLMLSLVVLSFMCFVTELVLVHCSSEFLAFLRSAVGRTQCCLGSQGLVESPCSSIYSVYILCPL